MMMNSYSLAIASDTDKDDLNILDYDKGKASIYV
jgi:hypothetical protein